MPSLKLPEEVRKPILDGALKDFKGTVRATFDVQLPDKTDAEVKKWLKTRAEGQDSKMALALMRDLFGLDTRKLLTEAKAPVRCINSAGGYKPSPPRSSRPTRSTPGTSLFDINEQSRNLLAANRFDDRFGGLPGIAWNAPD
jgi:hypothetical protein